MISRLSFSDRLPILAILRGVRPEEVLSISQVLVAAGISAIEIPLNSPCPFASIAKLARAYGDDVLVGAGTVLTPDDAMRVYDSGGQLIVAPDFNRSVVEATRNKGMLSVPSVFTPTEAFAAIRCGASALKLFPANLLGPAALMAWRAVLPRSIPLIATGGIDEHNCNEWLKAGSSGLGLGTSLYRPRMDASDVARRASIITRTLTRNNQKNSEKQSVNQIEPEEVK